MYTAEISRANPTCFIFLIDQSGSMADKVPANNTKSSKAEILATDINRLLQELVIRCAKPEPRDYFHIGVIKYGSKIGPAFGGILSDKELIPISEIAGNPLRVEERTRKVPDDAGGLVEQTIKFPVWFDPIADGGTPMCEALKRAKRITENWLIQHPNCYPPTIMNITDGEPTDGDPRIHAEELKQLTSSDGNILLLNLHISSRSSTTTIMFPTNSEELPDEYSKLMFEMSSIMPESMKNAATQQGFKVSDESRGFVFNADPVSIIHFLDIGTSGTKASNLR